VRPEWKAIMNSDVEDLLRDGMERFTADLRAPAGLVREAVRRRRRRLALGSVTGAAAALTAGGVALAAIVPGAPAATGTDIGTTAYVVQHVSSALTAAEPGDIAQIAVTRSVTAAGGKTVTTTAEEWSYGDRWRSVVYSPTGKAVYDEGFSSSSVYTLVSYLTRTWARAPGLGRPAAPAIAPFLFGLRHRILPLPTSLGYPRGRLKGPVAVPRSCWPVISGVPLLFQPGLPGIGFATGSLASIGFSAASLPAARALRNAISCGVLTVAGRQLVDGVNAIELSSRSDSPISETIWVTPHTYLPVRVVIRSARGTPVLRQTADITWLQPTAQNLAKLAVPVPAGFRKVSLPRVLLPMARKIGPKFLLGSGRLLLLWGRSPNSG
jgi:hypothetical protein